MSGGITFSVAHEHTEGGGSGKHFRYAIALDDFPRDSGIRIVDGAFAEHGGDTGAERRIDDVGVPDDPTDVGSAPEDIAIADIVIIFQMVGGADHVSAVDVHDAFGLAGGTGGVKKE